MIIDGQCSLNINRQASLRYIVYYPESSVVSFKFQLLICCRLLSCPGPRYQLLLPSAAHQLNPLYVGLLNISSVSFFKFSHYPKPTKLQHCLLKDVDHYISLNIRNFIQMRDNTFCWNMLEKLKRKLVENWNNKYQIVKHRNNKV
jgi:hypothetical protein